MRPSSEVQQTTGHRPVGSVLADHGGRGPGELAKLGGAVVVCLLQAVVLARLLSTAKLLRARTAK